MTADDRLNQLEPLLSEAMSILDRHTAQLKQLSFAISQVSTAVVQQGENISFLLREQLTMKTQQNEMKTQQDGMADKLDHIIQLLQKPGQ